MAEQQKNSSLSEENLRICPHCKSAVSYVIRYVENSDNETPGEGGLKKKDIKYLRCGAMGCCKAEDSNNSAAPKAEVKKCEELNANDKMLQNEDTEKLMNRQNKRNLLAEMMRKYPQMVAVEVETDRRNFGEDFDIFCTACPATFNDLEVAEQHFKANLNDKTCCCKKHT